MTVVYTSQGLVNPVTIQLFSITLGLLATITNAAPTAGSYQFTVPTPPQEPITDAYLRLSTPGGAAAQSALFAYYKVQAIVEVTVPADTLYKGETYRITWTSTGPAFPVHVLLYYGTPERQAVTGEACVPWNDPQGNDYTGCVLSYDNENEMCATQVDDEGLWVQGEQCKPLSSTFKLVLPVVNTTTTVLSTDGQATLTLAAASTDLPSPGEPYSIVVAAAVSGIKHDGMSDYFTIGSASVMLDFKIFQTDPGVALDVLRKGIWTFLADALGVEPERVGVELTSLRQASETTQYRVLARIQGRDATTEKSAYEAAHGFVTQWEDARSGLYAGVATDVFRLDVASEPKVELVEEPVAEAMTQAPTPVAGLQYQSGESARNVPLSFEPHQQADKGPGITSTTSDENGVSVNGGGGGREWAWSPVAVIVGGVATLVGVALLAFLGVYVARRRYLRVRTESVLRMHTSV